MKRKHIDIFKQFCAKLWKGKEPGSTKQEIRRMERIKTASYYRGRPK